MPIRLPTSYGLLGAPASADPAKLPDETPAFSRLLAAMRPGDYCRFPTSRRQYRIDVAGLLLAQPGTLIDFEDSTVVTGISAPYYAHLYVSGTDWQEKTLHAWTADVDAGWLTVPALEVPAWLALGVDPMDANEEHYGCILDPGTSEVLIPEPINGRSHKIVSLARVVERVTIRDLRVKSLGVTDANLVFQRVRDCVVDGLRGDVTIGVSARDVDGLVVDNVDVRLTHTHPAAGFALAAWQTRNLRVGSIRVTGDRCGCLGFESNCRDVHVRSIHATFDEPAGRLTKPLVVSNGGTRGVVIDRVKLDTAGGGYFWDTGGQKNQEPPRFGVIETTADTSVAEQYPPVWRRLIKV